MRNEIDRVMFLWKKCLESHRFYPLGQQVKTCDYSLQLLQQPAGAHPFHNKTTWTTQIRMIFLVVQVVIRLPWWSPEPPKQSLHSSLMMIWSYSRL